MGMGMLFAGAMTGAGRAIGSMADDAIKREDDQRKYQMQVQERRDSLLFEMEQKEKFARRVEQADAQSYERAVDSAQAVGGDRRFAKFSADMEQAGYGEGMDDAQKRVVFDQHYNNKPALGYQEPESAGKADILSEMRRSGASGSAIKAAREDYTAQAKAEQAAAEAQRKERSDLAREDLRNRQLDQQWAIGEANRSAADDRLGRTLEARSKSGAGGGLDQTEKLTVLKDVKAKADASKPKIDDYLGSKKSFDAAMGEWRKSEDGKISAEASRRIMQVFGAGDVQAAPVDAPSPARSQGAPAQPDASRAAGDIAANERSIALLKKQPLNRGEPQSSRDEQIRMIEAENARMRGGTTSQARPAPPAPTGPPKVASKHEFDALPSGATFIAPDGTTRRKP